jgi:hypothetical protein
VSSTKDGARVRRNRTRAAITTAAVLIAAAFSAGTAQANLAAVSPDPAPSGHPLWYQDSLGVKLGFCFGDARCPSSPAVLEDVVPNDEAFYYSASATMSKGAATVTTDYVIEAAFLNGAPITFGRLQFTAEGLQPGGTYTVEHPWGTSRFTVNAAGELVGGARAGQREETSGAFDDTLNTPIGPFLQSTSATAPYLGDGITATTVVGGKFRNTVRVFGPGLPEAVTDVNGVIVTPAGITTDQFTIEGKLFNPADVLPVPSPPVPPDTDGDGVIDSVDLCVNQQGPAANNGCPPPVIIDNTKPTQPTQPAQVVQQTVIQQIPGVGVQGAAARSLAVSRLSLARRISITRLRRQGLRASMRLQQGTNVVRIAVYKARNGQRTGRALFTTTRVARSGLYRVTLRNRSLLRKLKTGSYVMQVQAGETPGSLGRATQIGFRVTR